MAAEDRVRWDEIYRTFARQPYPAPDPFLLEHTPIITTDTEYYALDLAGGMGQNGLWLAEQGYITDVMDISRVALYRARVEMTVRNLRNVNLLQVDIDTLDLHPYHYDIVCVFRYLRRDTLPAIRQAVKPGGRVIYESYNLEYLTHVPEFNTRFLLQHNELLDNFQGWEVVAHEEDEHITRLTAIRPEESESVVKARQEQYEQARQKADANTPEVEHKDDTFEW